MEQEFIEFLLGLYYGSVERKGYASTDMAGLLPNLNQHLAQHENIKKVPVVVRANIWVKFSVQASTPARARKHARAHTHTYTHIHIHTRARARTHIHMCAHTHIHTNKQTHVQASCSTRMS